MTKKETKGREISVLLGEWVPELCGTSGINKYVHMIEDTESGEFRSVKFLLYTEDHQYSIKGTVREDGSGYLGCIVSARKPRAGEDWTRGNDLPDGDFTKGTWDEIIRAIARYELRPLSQRTTSPVVDTEKSR